MSNEVSILDSRQSIYTNGTITSSGSTVLSGFGGKEVNLIINVTASPTGGSPTIQFTITEVDPGDLTTTVGSTVTGASINSITTQIITLPTTKSGTIKISWAVGGSSPSFTGVYLSLSSKTASTAIMYDASGNAIGTASNPFRIDPVGSTVQTISGTVNQGTAAALSGYWPVRITDGTNTMPTGDVIGRAIFHKLTDGTNTAAVTASSALKVDGSAVTQPVSGTVAATQSGTWTVQPGNTANTTPWLTTINQGGNSATVTASNALKVDGSAVTQPVSGTVTANAGTGNFTVVQATAANLNATVVQSTAANLRSQTASESATGSATPATAGLAGGAVTTAAPTYTTGNLGALSLTTSGSLRVDGSGSTQPVSGTVTSNQGTANTLANGWPVKVTDGTNTMPTADVAARAQFHKITDGTNTVAVKAASTAPVATDSALVVAISPNNALIGSLARQVQGTSPQGSAPVGNPILLGGVDPSGNMIDLQAGAGGSLAVGIRSNEYIVSSNAAITANGSQIISNNHYGVQQINLIVNVTGSITGTTPTLQYTIQEVDPGDNTTTFGNSASTSTINAIGVYTAVLTTTTSGVFKVSWTVGGTSPSFGGVYATVVSKATSTQSGSSNTNGFVYGTVTTGATTNVPVRASTYNEQTTNAQRSIKSSSANDSSAGTGARAVKLTYYDQTGNGPFTESITMNGTTAVNTVNTNICFIESIVVTSVGSTGSNVGTLTLYTTTGGGGTTIAVVNATDNRTLWAHHYVASSKTCYITSMTGNNNNGSNITLFSIWAQQPTVANSPNILVSDTLANGGGTAQTERSYGTPIKVSGPSRIVLYGQPAGTPTIINRGSFDFYEQ